MAAQVVGRRQLPPLASAGERKLYSDTVNPVLGTSPAQVQSKRQQIVREIYDTEYSYISQLNTIITLFLKPTELGSFLPTTAIRAIFSNMEEILAINQQLFSRMRQRSLGEAFSNFGPYLKLYSTYARDYQASNETLVLSRKRHPNFTHFLTSQELRPECRGFALSQLLIIPIQRIPRYKLLLEKLLKCTKMSHPDYEKLKGASVQIADVAKHINEQIRRHENSQKMLDIQSHLHGAPPIIAPGRWFLREERLMKICRKRAKERMVFLFSDVLIYARPRSRLREGGRGYGFRCMLPLLTSSVEIVPAGQHTTTAASQMFRVYNEDTSLTFYSNDDHNVWQWVEDIRKTCRRLRDAYSSLLTSQKLPLPPSPSPSPHTASQHITLQTMSYPLTATFKYTDFRTVNPKLSSTPAHSQQHAQRRGSQTEEREAGGKGERVEGERGARGHTPQQQSRYCSLF